MKLLHIIIIIIIYFISLNCENDMQTHIIIRTKNAAPCSLNDFFSLTLRDIGFCPSRFSPWQTNSGWYRESLTWVKKKLDSFSQLILKRKRDSERDSERDRSKMQRENDWGRFPPYSSSIIFARNVNGATRMPHADLEISYNSGCNIPKRERDSRL